MTPKLPRGAMPVRAAPSDLAARRLEAVERRLDLALRALAVLLTHDNAVPRALRERLAHETEDL